MEVYSRGECLKKLNAMASYENAENTTRKLYTKFCKKSYMYLVKIDRLPNTIMIKFQIVHWGV